MRRGDGKGAAGRPCCGDSSSGGLQLENLLELRRASSCAWRISRVRLLQLWCLRRPRRERVAQYFAARADVQLCAHQPGNRESRAPAASARDITDRQTLAARRSGSTLAAARVQSAAAYAAVLARRRSKGEQFCAGAPGS